LKTTDFDYDLPEELIAQTPLDVRCNSRLLVVDRKTHEISDKHFYDVIDYLNEGDCLVLNDSRVIPARILGEKEETGAKIEFLLHKDLGGDVWEVMARPGKRLKTGTKITFGPQLRAEVLGKKEDGLIDVRFDYTGIFLEVLGQIGHVPLPPYIKKTLEDENRYQTVYARLDGSCAAPTAGLHFTQALLDKIRAKGVDIVFVMLHVGLGTFLPVSSEDVSKHVMHTEYYQITEQAAERINATKAAGKRVVAVGTTVVRTLESSAKRNGGAVKAECCETDIFIYPGFRYEAVDALVTNFHLPKSTLIMLVSAFYDKGRVLEIYRQAVEKKYRFFSFGDAMLLI
jgi:S-adenosylmethionine:tRNA ribosyltransferase-isomerase